MPRELVKCGEGSGDEVHESTVRIIKAVRIHLSLAGHIESSLVKLTVAPVLLHTQVQ